MAESINQQIADKLAQRQIRTTRVEASLRQQVLEQLAVLEQDILQALKAADPSEFALLSRRRREVEQLMQDIGEMVDARYEHMAALLTAALLRLAQNEVMTVQEIVNSVSDEQPVTAIPSDRQLRAGVTQSLFPSPSRPVDPSAVGSEWWTRAATSFSQHIRDSLLVGVSLEESTTQLSQRLRGTPDNAFQDGIFAKGRETAQRVLTTQTTNALGEARAAVGQANARRVIQVHTSILDSRTSLVCLGRNGLKYDAATHEGIGHDMPYLSGIPYHPS
jgi:hypothetical protein